MSRFTRSLAPTTTVRAHCDLPCGVYDPEQARIEAESCSGSWRSTRPTGRRFSARAIAIKEERADLVKHHLDVLWHDYFKPEHLEAVPNLHDLFWKATKAASKVEGLGRPGRREGAARRDRRDRRRVEENGRPGEDARRRAAG